MGKLWPKAVNEEQNTSRPDPMNIERLRYHCFRHSDWLRQNFQPIRVQHIYMFG